jgi:hypothetical protein
MGAIHRRSIERQTMSRGGVVAADVQAAAHPGAEKVKKKKSSPQNELHVTF